MKREGSPTEEDPEPKRMDTGEAEVLVLKLLLPGKEVGNVIGKAGSVLKSLEADTGSRIRISAIDEVIPTTRERIATISGSIEAVKLAAQRVCAILFPAHDDATSVTENAVKLLMPHASIGVVIGRGGTVIKEIMQQTGTTIKISQPSPLCILQGPHRWGVKQEAPPASRIGLASFRRKSIS